jgi:hypothetical protein
MSKALVLERLVPTASEQRTSLLMMEVTFMRKSSADILSVCSRDMSAMMPGNDGIQYTHARTDVHGSTTGHHVIDMQ